MLIDSMGIFPENDPPEGKLVVGAGYLAASSPRP